MKNIRPKTSSRLCKLYYLLPEGEGEVAVFSTKGWDNGSS